VTVFDKKNVQRQSWYLL